MQRIAKIIYAQLCDKVGRQIRKVFLNPIQRSKLNSTNFSILSQNCVGSIWYHDLGLQFTSPTINMKFDPNDWIEFLDNFTYYVNRPITFEQSNKPYPVGRIGGKIFVEFVHYHSEQEVLEKWTIRCKRLLNRRVVLAFDEGMADENVFRFLNMISYRNRLLFIERERAEKLGILGNSHVISVLRGCGGGNASLLNFSDLLGHRFYDKYFDYVGFLNDLK